MTLSPNSACLFKHYWRQRKSLQPPKRSCKTDWGIGQLLPAAGTKPHMPDHCTKNSHYNRFDACTTLGKALASAPVWTALMWASVPESAVAPETVMEMAMEVELAPHPTQPLRQPSNWYEVRYFRSYRSAGDLSSSRCREECEATGAHPARAEPMTGTRSGQPR